jgi:DNA-binding MarR family transcriptional regulator
VALTPSGMTFIGAIFPEHAAVIAEIMAALTPGEQETAARLLRQLGLSLRQAPDPSD